MSWTTVNFGKYAGKGKTLPQVVFNDPDWFFWAHETGAFKGVLSAEADAIARNAKKIKIPGKHGTSKVRYYINPTVGKLGNIEVIDASRGPHSGASPTRDSAYFDLSMARRISQYDKTGGKFVVAAIKYHVFGDTKTRLTKDKCECFFDDPLNFA